MTLLQIINRVLRRLREDQATDFTDEYTLLLVEFLGDIHAEVLEDHDWSSMDHTSEVAVASGTYLYDLSATVANGGNIKNGDTVTTHQSVLRYNKGQPLVFWYDTDTDPQGEALVQVSWQHFEQLYSENTTLTATSARYFAIRLNAEGYQLAIWPAPDSTGGVVRLRFHTPETVISTDDATTREVLAPWRPLVQGVLMLALNERGEEIGEPGNIAERRYFTALTAAKEVDVMVNGRTNDVEFYRD